MTMNNLTAAALRLLDVIETTGLAELPRKAVSSILAAADAVIAAAEGQVSDLAAAYRGYAAAVISFLVEDGRDELEQLQVAGHALRVMVQIDSTEAAVANVTVTK